MGSSEYVKAEGPLDICPGLWVGASLYGVSLVVSGYCGYWLCNELGVPRGDGTNEGLEGFSLWSYMDALKLGSNNGSLSASAGLNLLISYSEGGPVLRYLSNCECLMPTAVGAGEALLSERRFAEEMDWLSQLSSPRSL